MVTELAVRIAGQSLRCRSGHHLRHPCAFSCQRLIISTDIRQEYEGDSEDCDLGPAASAETVSDQQEQHDQLERQPLQQQQQRRRQRQRQQGVRLEHHVEAATLGGGDQVASGVSLADSAIVAAEGGAGAKAVSDPADGSLDGTDGTRARHVLSSHLPTAVTLPGLSAAARPKSMVRDGLLQSHHTLSFMVARCRDRDHV